MASVILRTMSEDERIRQEYYQREKWAMDKASQAAYIKAKEEEAAQLQKKLKTTVMNLIQRGYTIEEIADITGLSAEEIKKLQEN